MSEYELGRAAENLILAYGSWRGITDPIQSARFLLALDDAWQRAHAESRYHYCLPDTCAYHSAPSVPNPTQGEPQ